MPEPTPRPQPLKRSDAIRRKRTNAAIIICHPDAEKPETFYRC